MLELIVVMAIMGLLMGIAVSNWGTMISTYRLNAASRQIFADLQRARMRAVMENIDFDLNVPLASSANYELRRSTTVLEEKSVPDGIVFQSAVTISFTSRGTAAGGTVELCNSAKDEKSRVVVNGAGRMRICQVSGCSAGTC